jgi:hypothetical protein
METPDGPADPHSRLLQSAPANREACRLRQLFHPEALLEQHQHVPQLDLQLGRSGQLSDPDPHDARRQLQQPVSLSLNAALLLYSQLMVQVQSRRYPPGRDEPQEHRGDLCATPNLRQVVSLTCRLAQALLLFGNGDGGGGPTPPMLEKLRRIRATTKQHDVGGMLPPLKMGGSFEQFFDSVREETINGGKLPNWRGELYAEFHRWVGRFSILRRTNVKAVGVGIDFADTRPAVPTLLTGPSRKATARARSSCARQSSLPPRRVWRTLRTSTPKTCVLSIVEMCELMPGSRKSILLGRTFCSASSTMSSRAVVSPW